MRTRYLTAKNSQLESQSKLAKQENAIRGLYPQTKEEFAELDREIEGLELLVQCAKQERKTFTVKGRYQRIRKSLLSRGWIEKIYLTKKYPNFKKLKLLKSKTMYELAALMQHGEYRKFARKIIITNMLKNHQVDFCWDMGVAGFNNNPDNVKLTMMNIIRKSASTFSSKLALCEGMKNSHWHQNVGETYIRHPRSYSLKKDPEEFIQDFKTTAAVATLKWIVETDDTLISGEGRIPISMFHFALKECHKHLQKLQHDDIDIEIENSSDFEWNEYLEYFYSLVHVGNHFKKTQTETVESLVEKSKKMLDKLHRFMPHLDVDGFMNVWIIKPSFSSMGIGIHICRTLQYVLTVITENRDRSYVIQKYIGKYYEVVEVVWKWQVYLYNSKITKVIVQM